jgi:hypothetical protein
MPAAVSSTTRNSPSAVAIRSASPALPSVPMSARAVNTASPMAFPMLSAVEVMPPATPCSWDAVPVAAGTRAIPAGALDDASVAANAAPDRVPSE